MRWIYQEVTFIYGLLLFNHSNGDLVDLQHVQHVVDTIVNDLGQLEYQGRTIRYKTEGRFHSFSEPWVYDGVAWDIKSGTSVKVNHFDESEEAARKAVEKLILEWHQKRIIEDRKSRGNEVLRFVIVGTIGTGKSSTGNSIVGLALKIRNMELAEWIETQPFRCHHASPQARNSKRVDVKLYDRQIAVLDTPGLYFIKL